MPVVAFTRSTTFAGAEYLVTAFREGLKEVGLVEGRNVLIELHAADDQVDRLQALTAELIRRPVSVIVGNTISALAAKANTTAIPIVFATGSDPIREGLVTSLSRPGGNVTGVVFISGTLGTKRLELLRQFVPKATTIAVLVQSNNVETEAERKEVQAAAQSLGLHLVIAEASNDQEIDAAFATFVQGGVGALFVGAGPFLFARRARVLDLADRHAMPAMYSQRDSVLSGGLMSYSASQPDAYRQSGLYTGRILKGEKPGDLPVIQSTKFELVINLLATADEVFPPALLPAERRALWEAARGAQSGRMKSKMPRHCRVSPSWCFGLPALSRLSLRASAPQLFRYASWRPRAPG
jgi:putative ABC transport system substrate-binding protein